MTISEIECIQLEIQEARDKFLSISFKYLDEVDISRKQKAYSENRNIVLQKLQESMMWLNW